VATAHEARYRALQFWRPASPHPPFRTAIVSRIACWSTVITPPRVEGACAVLVDCTRSVGAMPPKKWEAGPPVRALCLGINAYDHLPPLENCENDAEQIARGVQMVPDGRRGCVATIRKGPQLRDKLAMKNAISSFLADIDKQCPPRMVLISVSCHAIQDGADILMAPSAASKEPAQLKQESLSHNEIFSILYQEMHEKTKVLSFASLPCHKFFTARTFLAFNFSLC